MSADSAQSKVATALLKALEIAKSNGLLNCDLPSQITLDRPKNRDHGDYATSISLGLAKAANLQPRVIAEVIIKSLTDNNLLTAAGISKVEIAGPGFINITLESASQGAVVSQILTEGKKYGSGNSLAGKKINLEFVSANPTGPLHLGHTRWAAVGDSLGRVLSAAGAVVSREFYINDRGNQMDLFGQSLFAASQNKAIPENGYHGEYIGDLAKQIIKENPAFSKLTGDDAMAAFRDAGYKLQIEQQRQVLDNFGTHFDTWFSERTLYENDFFAHTLAKLKSLGHVYEEEGATWLRTTDFADDKDRVMIKSDGTFAYFASDSAYYVSKRERGFNLCIYMLGADHHGYVGRIKAIAAHLKKLRSDAVSQLLQVYDDLGWNTARALLLNKTLHKALERLLIEEKLIAASEDDKKPLKALLKGKGDVDDLLDTVATQIESAINDAKQCINHVNLVIRGH